MTAPAPPTVAKHRWAIRAFAIILAAGVVGGGWALKRAIALPAPGGQYYVGTTEVALAVPPIANGPATVPVRVWYPAAVDGPAAPYAGAGGDWLRRHLVGTHAAADVPPLTQPAKLPLLLYWPGWDGGRADGTALAEALASRGFVVAAMDDIRYGLPPGHLLARGMDLDSEAGFTATRAVADARLAAGAQRSSAVLSELLRATSAPFAGRLDPGRVGILGFSFGGAIAVAASAADPRFRGTLNMDGWLLGSTDPPPLAHPYFSFSDDGPPRPPQQIETVVGRHLQRLDNESDRRTDAILRTSGGYLASLINSEHGDFSDGPLLSFRRRLFGEGPDPVAQQRCIADAAAAYFSAALNGMPSTLLQSDLPGLRLRVWEPAAHGAAQHLVRGR